VSSHVQKGMDKKLLGLLYKRYVSKYEHGIRNIQNCPFSFMADVLFVDAMPELYVDEGSHITSIYMQVMKELEAQGYVVKDQKNLAYFFTIEGYRRAAMNRWDKALDFCNRNAGLAVVVAIFAALISLGSLAVSVKALNSAPASISPGTIKSSSPRMEPSRLVVIEGQDAGAPRASSREAVE